MGILVWLCSIKLRIGFEVRAVGEAPTSRYSGMRVKRVQITAFLASGALAGLIGLQEIFAIRGFYTYKIASGPRLRRDRDRAHRAEQSARHRIRGAPVQLSPSGRVRVAALHLGPNSVTYVISGLMIIIIVVSNELMTRYARNLRRKELASWNVLFVFLLRGLQMSAPIAFASLGGVFSERSGVVNIALEGIMLTATFAVVWGSLLFGSSGVGYCSRCSRACIMATIHAVVTVTYKVNQIVSGVAINILALGFTRFLSQAIYGQETQSPFNPFVPMNILGINSMALALIPIAALVWFVLFKTKFGLRLRSVGENPEAADTLGINVTRDALRRRHPLRGDVRSRGDDALPGAVDHEHDRGPRLHRARRDDLRSVASVGAVAASLLFGYAETFRIMFETQIPIPSQFVQMLPYVLAVVVLAGVVGRAVGTGGRGNPVQEGRRVGERTALAGDAARQFRSILIIYRFFGKLGLYIWIPIAAIVANIQVMKYVELFGLTATLGNIVYASSFLVTDILSENYGRKHANRAIAIGFVSLVAMVVLMNVALLFEPDAADNRSASSRRDLHAAPPHHRSRVCSRT